MNAGITFSLRVGAAVLIGCLAAGAAESATVGKWRRHVVSLADDSCNVNRFEREVEATFTHEASGATITLPGYYAGDDTWKIGFMPTLTGSWSWVSKSPDADLNGKTGSLDCVESGLPGMLKADPQHPRKWKYTDGGYVVPMAFRMEFFFEPATIEEFTAAADFLATDVRGQMYETRLLSEKGWWDGRRDYIFKGEWAERQFDLDYWDRMEARMEILTERGLGAHVMLYSDDRGEPGWAGRSPTEELVVRYVVARLAGYPVVWFNTGIDIGEYRTQGDIDWLADRFRELDPYDHPISSRRGGGSGGIAMAGRTFDSRGARTAKIDTLRTYFERADVPVSMDDAWGENRGSHADKDHSPADIRRAFWKSLMAGGTAGLVRGGADGLPSGTGYFSIKHVRDDLESEQWLAHINPWLQSRLGDSFATMAPESSWVSGSGVYGLADEAHSKVVVYSVGVHDRYDEGGGPIDVRLPRRAGTYCATWLDPRTGVETSAGILQGGKRRVFAAPTEDDWVLLLEHTEAAAETGEMEVGPGKCPVLPAAAG